MKSYHIIYVFCALIFCSCSRSIQPVSTKEYYEGEFTYFADAASMVCCSTGERLPVSNQGAYLETERGYTSLNVHGEPAFVEFYGHLIVQKSMEGDRNEVALVIDEFIDFDMTVMCNPDAVLVGVYEGSTPSGKYLLRLKSDYTYSQSFFAKDAGEDVSSGRWYLSSSAQMVIEQNAPSKSVSTFEVVPAQESLVKNSGGKPLVMTKVYLQ